MKKKNIIIGILIFLAVGATFFAFKWFGKNGKSAIQIETVTVVKGDINTVVTATGTIQPTRQVTVGTQVSGIVDKIYVDFNSRVQAGQLIAELDKTNLIASLKLTEANYNAALNELNYLQKIFDKQAALFKNNMISELEYEDAQYKLTASKTTVEQRQSDVVKAKTNLSYAYIYSPIKGVVLSKAVDVGQTVAASLNTPTLFTIAEDLTEMQVEANVDEADIGTVRVGQRVSFTVDAYPEKEFQGTVSQIRLNPTVTSNVVTYVVIVKAKNPDLSLIPGLTATITIFTMEQKNILTLEAKALSFSPDRELMKQYRESKKIAHEKEKEKDGEETYKNKDRKRKREKITLENDSMKMVRVLKNERTRPVKIKTGISDGLNVEIIRGLSEGDTVIYNMTDGSTATTASTTGSGGNTGSPFMPKMPNRKRR